MIKLFEKWFKKEKMEFSTPYRKDDLKAAYVAGYESAKIEFLKKLNEEIESNLAFYPIGGVCRPVLTESEIKNLQCALITNTESE